MSTSPRERDRIIALSALLQSVTLVQQIAETGKVNQVEFETLLNSLIATDAPNTEAVYGSIAQLKTGIEQLNNQLSKNKEKKDVQLLRYVISLLHLERRLAKRPAMLDLIGRDIDQIPQQIDYFGDINNPQVIARFADIYHRTISELTPRIQVHGDPTFLQHADNVNRVRAILLAGIRAAMLWHQKGGRRWQFIFQSSKILKISSSLYKEHCV
ncbi:MAG: high frequency lysogenization protein HflD [Methylophaga sp.]|nr:high frequency lysogenization protein HflD [Methylophaga sp.]